jgi:hypothetical protein
MAEERRALTELVSQHVGRGKRWSTRDFALRAVDPRTGYSPSKSLVGKIIADGDFRVTPSLIRALAIGMDIPREEVAEAAHEQYIGFDVADLAPDAHDRNSVVRMAYAPDVDPSELPKSRAWLARQEPDE